MEKENQVYRFCHKHFDKTVTEYHMRDFYNTTKIDIAILGDIKIFIQVKDGRHVNNTDALLAFCYECDRINKKSIKIWYTEFSVSKGFCKIAKRDDVHICDTIDSLYNICSKYRTHKHTSYIELRKYQKDAVNNATRMCDKSGIIIFPPGCGKTITALEITHELWSNGFKKIVWTTRKKELLLNGFNDVVMYKNMPVFNMISGLGKNNPITNDGLYIMNHEYIIKSAIIADYIVVDECHESGAPGIFNYLMKQKCPKLGLSATPYTGNQEHQNNVRKLFPNIFGELDPFTAIDKKYIMPLEFWFSDNPYKALSDAKKALCSSDKWFKCIAWCQTIKNCNIYGDEINTRFPDLVVYVSHSKNDTTNEQILRFKNETRDCVLVCVNKAREGWNDPRINCAIYLDEVHNRAFHVSIQTGNRVNRSYQGKTRAIVIDCVDRDPVDTILRYYFNYNPQSLYTYLCENKSLSINNNSIYYKETCILTLSESFYNQFTINDVFSQIQSRIYAQSDYQKFIDQFQKHLWTFPEDHEFRQLTASYDSYLIIIKDYPEFMPNPVLEFGMSKTCWAEIFGKEKKTILSWVEFKQYCVLNKPSNNIDMKEHYKTLVEKNSNLPENPSDAYKQFRNYSDLFGISRLRFKR